MFSSVTHNCELTAFYIRQKGIVYISPHTTQKTTELSKVFRTYSPPFVKTRLNNGLPLTNVDEFRDSKGF